MCCLIFSGTCDIFQDYLRNKKLKGSMFIQNINVVLQYTVLFKSLGSVIFFLSYFNFFINTFIQQRCVKLIKSDSKDLYC